MDNKTDRMVVPAESILPNRLVIVPVRGKPIFPGVFTPLMITDKQDIASIDAAIGSDSLIGLVLVRSEEIDEPSGKDLHRVGTAAKIVRKINLPDGGYNIFISTLKRFRVRKMLHGTVPITAAIEHLDDENDSGDEVSPYP